MPTQVESILRLEVPLIVQIAARTMKVGEVAKLTPGAIIELPKLADEDLDVLISNRQIGTGTAVKVGENFGIRITSVGDQTERIRAMGGADTSAPQTPATETSPTTAAEAGSESEQADSEASTS